jgi:hypothetical protein
MANTAAPLSFQQWADFVYNGNLTDTWRNLYEQGPREYDVVAKVESKPQNTGLVDELQGVQGIAKPEVNWDLNDLPQRSVVKGYKTTIRQVQYRSQLTAEETLYTTGRHQEIWDNLADLADSIKAVKDVTAVNIINNGTTGSHDYDIIEYGQTTGSALFSTTQYYEDGSGTFSNYLNSGLPPIPDVVYRVISEYIRRLKDNVGAFVNLGNEFVIWTPTLTPSFGMSADELVNSMDRPDTANRAINVLTQGRSAVRLSHRQLNYLTSTTKWYLSIPTTHRAYPLLMKESIPQEITPLSPIGATNPHVMKQTTRTRFGLGFRASYRGMVAIGT